VGIFAAKSKNITVLEQEIFVLRRWVYKKLPVCLDFKMKTQYTLDKKLQYLK
jgi:hypothetical protein